MKLRRLISEVCRLAEAASAFVSAECDLPTALQTQELRELLSGQSPAAVYMLITLWRLGR
jgi:hypothetical protein